MALVTGNKKTATVNTATGNKAQEETMMEEKMMQKTRESFEKVKAEFKAEENRIQDETVSTTAEVPVRPEEGGLLSDGAEIEIPALDGLIEGLFGGASVHINNVTIHIGDNMESVNFMGDAEIETDVTEETEEIEEETDEGADADDGDCCDSCTDCGFGTGHPIYVDTDLMEKVIAVSTGLNRKTVADVLKGIAMYLQVLAEDEENYEEECDGR